MNRYKRSFMFLVSFLLPLTLFAQMTVSGTVSDAATGNALPGANVVVEGTDLGAAADANGNYSIANVPAGATLTASMIGYTSSSATAAATVNFSLEASAIRLSALEVLASRADEKTPVAYTNITKADMEFRLGSQDIPMALNTTPSVYATQQGGGAGDARINIRGFNQRNIAVMINGVPQNDMENGWVYWSNWDGVGDATSSIQMQRGLSAVNLATPSIGGTMNIITDPSGHSSGGKFKQEIGAGGFMKSSLNYNTGLIGDNFAFSTTIVRKTGDGVIDKTWTDAWAYYFGVSYQMDDKNRFEIYAIGAPQRHGQNLYKQNIAAYDRKFAESVVDEGMKDADSDSNGVSDWVEYFAQFSTSGEDFDDDNGNGILDGNESYTDENENSSYDGPQIVGREFNQNWSPVSSDYKGQQYWYMYGVGGLLGGGNQNRYNSRFLNERENYFHKPLVNLNHYHTLNDQMRLSSVLYWSGGSGGGTGTYGKIPTMDANGNLGDDDYKFYYGSGPWVRDWNTLVDYNSGDQDTVYVDKKAIIRTHGVGNNQSVGILRNSINRQSTIGFISKLDYDMSDAVKLQFGVDWRTAEIEHAREVRDLMGGDYYVDYADDNEPDGKVVGLGDIIAYHNETTVDWLGFFTQGSYSSNALSAYGMFGLSTIKYSYQDHFSVADEVIKANMIVTKQYKGGAMFSISDNMSVFANYGVVEKPPIMDNVIYFDGTVAKDPANEKFVSTEAGVNFRGEMFTAKVNVYNTDWKDRNLTKSVTTGQGSSGDTDVIFLTGVNQNHKGFEFEASAQLMAMLRLDATFSLGNWQFVDDAKGDYQENEYDENDQVIGKKTTEYAYALDGVSVGDMPQTSYILGVTLTPIPGLKIQALYNMYDNNYADWDPTSRQVNDWGDDGIEGDGLEGEINPWETAYDNGEGDGVLSEKEWSYADRVQVWDAPGYSKVDLHLFYDLPSMGGLKFQAFAHVFNALDAVYVQDATDNSQYNGFKLEVEDENGNDIDINSHSAARAEVFLGTPRYFNAGITVYF